MTKLIYNLTHSDLDGVGCSILLSNAFSTKKYEGYNFQHKPIGYTYLIDYTVNHLSKLGDLNLIMTDLNCPMDVLESILDLPNVKTVLYIDHHQTYEFDLLEEIKNRYKNKLKVILDNSYCGTKLVFNYLLERNMIDASKFSFLVDIIDTYDRWLVDMPLFKEFSYPMNNIFWKYEYTNFFSKFKDGFMSFDNDDKFWIKTIMKKKMEDLQYLYKNHSTIIKNTILLITQNKGEYTNDFVLAYPKFDIYFIIKTVEKDKIGFSVRIKKDGISFLDIKQQLDTIWNKEIEIGGHDKAGGITINKHDLEDFLQVSLGIMSDMV